MRWLERSCLKEGGCGMVWRWVALNGKFPVHCQIYIISMQQCKLTATCSHEHEETCISVNVLRKTKNINFPQQFLFALFHPKDALFFDFENVRDIYCTITKPSQKEVCGCRWVCMWMQPSASLLFYVKLLSHFKVLSWIFFFFFCIKTRMHQYILAIHTIT